MACPDSGSHTWWSRVGPRPAAMGTHVPFGSFFFFLNNTEMRFKCRNSHPLKAHPVAVRTFTKLCDQRLSSRPLPWPERRPCPGSSHAPGPSTSHLLPASGLPFSGHFIQWEPHAEVICEASFIENHVWGSSPLRLVRASRSTHQSS